MLHVLPGRSQKEMRSLSQEKEGQESLAVWWHKALWNLFPITETFVWKAELVKNDLVTLAEDIDGQSIEGEGAAWLLLTAYCQIQDEWEKWREGMLERNKTHLFWTFPSPPQCRRCQNEEIDHQENMLQRKLRSGWKMSSKNQKIWVFSPTNISLKRLWVWLAVSLDKSEDFWEAWEHGLTPSQENWGVGLFRKDLWVSLLSHGISPHDINKRPTKFLRTLWE